MALSAQDAQAIAAVAQQLQVDPRVLGGLMELESGVNPNIWGGQGGQYRGLIQFGPGARKEVGLPDREMTISEQMPYVLKYFQQRGFKPGEHGPTELYRTVLVGNPNQSGTDSFGTNSDSAAKRMQPGGDLYQRFSAKFDKAGGSSMPASSMQRRPSSGDDSWMDEFTNSILRPSPMQGMDAGAGMTMPRGSVIDASDPLKTLANVSLRMAGADETRARFQGLQSSIAALTAAAFPGMKPISAVDLMLPEERQVMQRGGQNDSAVEALQAMLGGGSNPTAAQPMASGGSAMPLPQGAKPITALTTVEGGRFGAARPGRKHLAWDFADEDGTGLMLKPDSGARWGQIRPSDYGDIAELHTPDGSFRIIHGKKDRERGIYLQGGWGPGGPNAYAPHHDIAAIDPETGKQTGAFFDRGVLGKYLYSVRAR
jgi:hypothetical protein